MLSVWLNFVSQLSCWANHCIPDQLRLMLWRKETKQNRREDQEKVLLQEKCLLSNASSWIFYITQLKIDIAVLLSNGRNWAFWGGDQACSYIWKEGIWNFLIFLPFLSRPFVTLVNDTKCCDQVTEITFSKRDIPKLKFIQVGDLAQW